MTSGEGLVGAVLRQVGEMLNVRFAALEERLPPERNLRPPLQANAKRGRKGGPSDPTAARSRALSRDTKSWRAAGPVPAAPDGETDRRTASWSRMEEPWVTVIAKGRKRAVVAAEGLKRDTSRPAQKGASSKQRSKGQNIVPPTDGRSKSRRVGQRTLPSAREDKAKPRVRVRLPKKAAVVVSVPEGAELTVAEALVEARKNISLVELDISALEPKRAATGGGGG